MIYPTWPSPMTSLTFKVISAGAKIRQYGSIQANFIAVTELLNVN